MKRKEFASNEDDTVRSAMDSRQIMESNLAVIASHVFGSESLVTIFAQDSSTQELNKRLILQNTDLWVHSVLDGIEPTVKFSEEDKRSGRLGLAEVRLDSTMQVGALVMSPDRLQIKAQSSFSTIRANVCCFSGKWQYELQLESKGVMQVGWSMGEGDFSAEAGIGDTPYSFSYDGNRVRKWNLVTSAYGEAWQVGDVIGCTIDLDLGSIHFYRNGKDMGEAFSSIPLGPGCVYYAAVSLGWEEKLLVNFGSMPFKYPVESFLPLQQPPLGVVLRANQLLHWLYRVASGTKIAPQTKTSNASSSSPSIEAVCLLFSELLLRHLAGLLTKPYVVDACLVPFLHDIINVTIDTKSLPLSRSLSKLNIFCDSLALLLEPDDFKELLNTLCKCLILRFNQVPVSLEYSKQKKSLATLLDILKNQNVRKAFLKQNILVKTRIPEFMDVKQIDVIALKECVPEPWWPSEEYQKGQLKSAYELKKQSYLENCSLINSKITELEAMQESVLMQLLTNVDGTTFEASSRKYFLYIFRQFLKENHITGLVSSVLNNQNVELISPSIALNYFHRLVGVLRAWWWAECSAEPVRVPLAVFYNGSIDYFSLERLGGVLSHLVHMLRPSLVTELGEDHRVFSEEPQQTLQQPVHVQIRGIDANSGFMSTLTRWVSIGQPAGTSEPLQGEPVSPDSISSLASLVELLDGVILLYNIAAHKQLQRVSNLRDDMDKYIAALNEAKARLSLAKGTCPEAAVQIELSIKAFEQKLENQSQVSMSWIRGSIYTAEHRDNLTWVLSAVLLTLEQASLHGELFAFVPDFYLQTMVEMSTALRNYFSPTLPFDEMPGSKTLLVRVAEVLVNCFNDERVVNPGCKDIVVEALAGFVAKKQTLKCLESMTVRRQIQFVNVLLKPYDNRPWGQTNWILMRIWQGCGFAFRYQKSPHLSRKLGPRTPINESPIVIHQAFEPCPSTEYQRLVARTLCEDSDVAAEFLNSLLKQLNWSFSEFISMIQEIQNLSKRPERVIIDARQLKLCATCFDFVISLLRVLEMLCTTCLPIFTDIARDGTENLLERLSQLLSQILLRVTSPNGCFVHVISLEVPDLDSIDQFPVLAAVVGVLVALLSPDILDKESTNMSLAAKSLLLEPAFEIDLIKYVLGESEGEKEKRERFSFTNYPQAVTVDELETVSRLISVLNRYKTLMSVTKEVDEEELCPICCAMPLAVTFIPCQHQSCKSCITHHLMDCKDCFFCKSTISSVVATDGKLVFDSNASAHKGADIAK